MSMSTYAVGLRPPDEKWTKMKAIYDACDAAGVDAPDDVSDFFGDKAPDPSGVVVDIDAAVSEYLDEYRQGLEVDLSKLPKDVTVIRFLNSW